MADADNLLYAHSGKLGNAPWMMPLIGLPLLLVTSLVYSYIAVYSPVVGYLTILVLFGYVFVNGLLLGWLARLSRCRSERFVMLAGLGGGLFALYFSWVEFEVALFNRYADGGESVATIDVLLSPAVVWTGASLIAQEGWYSVFGGTPSGIVLWLIWLVEAAIIVFGTMMLTSVAIGREVFCEGCGAWCKTAESRRLQVDREFTRRPVESIAHDELMALPEQKGKAFPHVVAEVMRCDRCKATTALRFARVTQAVNSDGKKEEKSEDIPGILLQPT